MADRHEVPRRAPPYPPSQPLTEAELERNAKILARVLYRDLQANGFSQLRILAIVQELIACVSAEMDTSRAS